LADKNTLTHEAISVSKSIASGFHARRTGPVRSTTICIAAEWLNAILLPFT
jgi:hypothetical protein